MYSVMLDWYCSFKDNKETIHRSRLVYSDKEIATKFENKMLKKQTHR